MGPSINAMKRLAHDKRIGQLFHYLGEAGADLLSHIVLRNQSLPAWNAAHPTDEGKPADRRHTIGRLLQVLDRCVEWQDAAEDRSGRDQRVGDQQAGAD